MGYHNATQNAIDALWLNMTEKSESKEDDLIRVVSITKIAEYDTNGFLATALHCSMSDGSIWKCTAEGTNWQMVSPSPEHLTKMFHKKQSPSVGMAKAKVEDKPKAQAAAKVADTYYGKDFQVKYRL